MLPVRTGLVSGWRCVHSAASYSRRLSSALGRKSVINDRIAYRPGSADPSRSFSVRRVIVNRGQRKPFHNKDSRVEKILMATGGVTVASGVIVYMSNQDEAPFTKRKRFMVFDRDGNTLKHLGDGTWTEIKAKYRDSILPDDHKASQTVTRVGGRIADVSGLQNCKWEFLVVKSEELNAFCLPGGKVVVFTGMFAVTPDEASLASVLGHEVGHVVANHSGEQLSGSILKEVVMLVVHLGMSLVTDMDFRGLGRQLGVLLYDLPNSREMEREADFIGMQLMAKACYDPRAMPKTFARMKDADKNRPQTPKYMSTHPTSDERIAKQTEWMQNALQTFEDSSCGIAENDFRKMFAQQPDQAF